jgi:hypothetical protein
MNLSKYIKEANWQAMSDDMKRFRAYDRQAKKDYEQSSPDDTSQLKAYDRQIKRDMDITSALLDIPKPVYSRIKNLTAKGIKNSNVNLDLGDAAHLVSYLLLYHESELLKIGAELDN